MDGSDSGTPSSKERIGAKEARRARQQSERERSKDRRRGGQPGHPGKGLARDPDPGERKEAAPPAECRLRCKAGLDGAQPAGQGWAQVIDVEIVRAVTEWALPGLACPCCGTVTFAAPPPGAHAGSVSYGAVLNAAAVLLTAYGNVPPERATQLMGMLLGAGVSAGWVDKAGSRLSALLGTAGLDEAMIAALPGARTRHRPVPLSRLRCIPPLGADIGRRRVPIDHVDPPDDPDTPRPPDGPPPADAISASPPDPVDRDAIHRAYRAQVDRIYAARLDSIRDGVPADGVSLTWAESVPSSRATWEEHQERYPERARATPRTHPDNSWSSGDVRRLTPAQNTEAIRACADIHDEGERVIFPVMRRIEAADPDRHLGGLEHMLKGTDRLKEKIAERLRYHPDLAPRQAAADVPDAVRFTFQYSESHYTEGIRADVDRLKEAGYELLKLKNLWAKDQYKGINSQWLRPETGLRFEVQFHTSESREAKELTHKAYERLRDPLTSKVEESALEDYQRRVNALVRLPTDVFTIEDYPPEKRDG